MMVTVKKETTMDIDIINNYIQEQLRLKRLKETTAVEAAGWLDAAGILKDSIHRPGKPLRKLLRQGLIKGQRQEPNRRWYIERI